MEIPILGYEKDLLLLLLFSPLAERGINQKTGEEEREKRRRRRNPPSFFPSSQSNQGSTFCKKSGVKITTVLNFAHHYFLYFFISLFTLQDSFFELPEMVILYGTLMRAERGTFPASSSTSSTAHFCNIRGDKVGTR